MRTSFKIKEQLPFFSYLFHPIFTSMYATALYLFRCASQSHKKGELLGIVALFTFALPICCYFFLKAIKKIDSMMLAKVSQRKIPLFLGCLFFVFLLQNETLAAYTVLHTYFFGCLLSGILAFLLVLSAVKASLHMVAMSGILFFVTQITQPFTANAILWLLFFVAANLLVAASRLQMKAHIPKELTLGFIIGILPQIVLFWFF